MRHYEIVLLLRVGGGVNMSERYKKMIADSGGALHRFEDWGNRVLAYPLQKHSNAQYLLFNIECEQKLLEELRESFRFSEQVLRFMITAAKGAITEKSPVLADMERIAKEEAEAAKAEAERPPEAKTAARPPRSAKPAKDNSPPPEQAADDNKPAEPAAEPVAESPAPAATEEPQEKEGK